MKRWYETTNPERLIQQAKEYFLTHIETQEFEDTELPEVQLVGTPKNHKEFQTTFGYKLSPIGSYIQQLGK